MSSYPEAYCVRCGKHTATLQKHTIVLQNNSRAMKGVCSQCEGEVYRILQRKNLEKSETPPPSKNKDDVYCVRCHLHTQTNNRRSVVLGSGRRALKGECSKCGCDVYKILPDKDKIGSTGAEAPQRFTVIKSLEAEPKKESSQFTAYLLTAMLVIGLGASVFFFFSPKF